MRLDFRDQATKRLCHIGLHGMRSSPTPSLSVIRGHSRNEQPTPSASLVVPGVANSVARRESRDLLRKLRRDSTTAADQLEDCDRLQRSVATLLGGGLSLRRPKAPLLVGFNGTDNFKVAVNSR